MLHDKVAVIYGTGGAIGGAVARAFASEGAKVLSPAPPGLVLTKWTAMRHRTAEQSTEMPRNGAHCTGEPRALGRPRKPGDLS